MHPSSMENMQRCIEWYLGDEPLKVIDLGAMNVNGSYRELFSSNVEYIGVDLEEGPGIDIVLEDVYKLPFDDSSIDLVLSGQMIEHCGQFWRVFSEIARVLKPEGIAFIIAPSTGPVHRYPVDCYRFYPDSYQALAEWSNLRLVHSWTDERGPWKDIVGIFQKGTSLNKIGAPKAYQRIAFPPFEAAEDSAVEACKGSRGYREVLQEIHTILMPKQYLEIGVRGGASLKLARCKSIGIDPSPLESFSPDNDLVSFFQCTSDDFFFFHAKDALKLPIQLAFIDGLHLSENVYRDFINVEQFMDPHGAIVIDDVLPNHRLQALRARESRVWTGDVWRFAEILKEKRPDLNLTWLDTWPTGILVITKLKPKNRVLWEQYNPLLNKLKKDADMPVPERILSRTEALPPTTDNIRKALQR